MGCPSSGVLAGSLPALLTRSPGARRRPLRSPVGDRWSVWWGAGLLRLPCPRRSPLAVPDGGGRHRQPPNAVRAPFVPASDEATHVVSERAVRVAERQRLPCRRVLSRGC